MMLKTHIKEAADCLLATKQRTLLAVFGIAVGIGSVTAMVSAGTMVEHEALKEFEELGTDVIAIAKSVSSNRSGDESIRLADAVDLPATVASIAEVAPYTR
ncbi:MAG: ABC transporter permease, partial [Gammaproteobacteria bacterium]|nr:ABC transporter permease [Gammaproteobacteria bacterium]